MTLAEAEPAAARLAQAEIGPALADILDCRFVTADRVPRRKVRPFPVSANAVRLGDTAR